MSSQHSAACPCCASTAPPAQILEVREQMLGMGEPFRYSQCGSCGSLVLTDPPSDLGRFYPDDYYSYAEPQDPGVHPVLSRLMAMLLRWPRLARQGGRSRFGGTVFPFAGSWFGGLGLDQSSRILDVGAGGGTQLARLRWLGFRQLEGIDPYLPVPERQVGPIRVRRAGLSEVEGTYDAVVFHHVLEHVDDPVAELRAARARLRPGGCVLVFVPLADSEAFERYGPEWIQLDAPRHLAVPTAAGIAEAAARGGLTVTDHWRDGSAIQFWGSEQYRRSIPLHAPDSWLTDPAASPFSEQQARAWEREARELNDRGLGDQGGFALRA